MVESLSQWPAIEGDGLEEHHHQRPVMTHHLQLRVELASRTV